MLLGFIRLFNQASFCSCLPPSWSFTCFTSAEIFIARLNGTSGAPNDFGIVIVDHFLGENRMLGTVLVELLRNENLYKGLVIGCSGDDRNRQYLNAGANLFWGKPAPENNVILESFIDYQALFSGQ